MQNSITSAANYTYGGSCNAGSSIPYIQQQGSSSVICHGLVTEIERHEIFYSRFHKLVNSLFMGEPYQFGHQTEEYTIRVEEMSNSSSREIKDFNLYGKYMGRLYPGDEVELKATGNSSRMIVKSIDNISTGSTIKPGIQLPAALVRVLVIGVIILLIALIYYIANSPEVSSEKYVPALAIVTLAGIRVRSWIRRIFHRRFRR